MLKNVNEQLESMDDICQEMYKEIFLAESLALYANGGELNPLNNIAVNDEHALLLNIRRVQTIRDYLKRYFVILNSELNMMERIKKRRTLTKIKVAIEDATEFLDRIFKIVSGGMLYAQLK